MKSYRVTNENPMFKDGLIFKGEGKKSRCIKTDIGEWWYNDEKEIKDHLSKGWIEEVEEKEFTRSEMNEEMINIINWFRFESTELRKYSSEYLKDYQKEKNEKS